MRQRRPSMDKDTRRMVKALLKQGCVLKGGKHPKIVTPCGTTIVIAGTPGKGRSMQNARAHFKRYGLIV